MRINNQTPYPTRALRAIMVAVYREVAANWGPPPRQGIVRIRPRDPRIVRWTGNDGVQHEAKRSRSYTGRASLAGHRAVLGIPTTGLDVLQFAHLWRHELFHWYGVRHADYPRGVLYFDTEVTPQIEAKIVERFGVRIEPEAATVAPVEDKIAAKLTALEGRERRWRTVARRATTYLAKIRRSMKYYEAQVAKAAKPSQPSVKT